MEVEGFEPAALCATGYNRQYRMRSDRSTPELYPLASNRQPAPDFGACWGPLNRFVTMLRPESVYETRSRSDRSLSRSNRSDLQMNGIRVGHCRRACPFCWRSGRRERSQKKAPQEVSCAQASDAGTRTRVSWVKAKYADHLHHIGMSSRSD